MSPTPDDQGLWVRSEVMPDGTYGVGINVGADRSWALDRDQAVAYAVACIARATEVEHDAAVLKLLTSLGLPEKTSAELIVNDIRPDRADDQKATAPLAFYPALGRIVGPFLRIQLDGDETGTVTPADLRDHAVAVLQAISAADLDANLRKVLVGPVGLPEHTARAVISDLSNHWPERQEPRK